MGASSARQSQRIPIDAPVRLTLRAQELTRTLPARAIDLSEGGIRVATDVVLPVGEEVTCSLELSDERASLQGRVRWSRPAPSACSGIGLGIQWGSLNDEHTSLLRRWLADHTPRSELVLLHVPGWREPLRARGSVHSDGLQLSATLPQLTLGAELEFQLGELGSRRSGRVERVELHRRSGQGELELCLQLLPTNLGRSRRNLVYEADEHDAPRLPPTTPAPSSACARPRRTTAQHTVPPQHEAGLAAEQPATAGAASHVSALTASPRAGSGALATLPPADVAVARARAAQLARQVVHEPRTRARTSSQSARDARGRRALGKGKNERRARNQTVRVPTLNATRLRLTASWVFAATSIAALVWALQDEPDPAEEAARERAAAAAMQQAEPETEPSALPARDALAASAGSVVTAAAESPPVRAAHANPTPAPSQPASPPAMAPTAAAPPPPPAADEAVANASADKAASVARAPSSPPAAAAPPEPTLALLGSRSEVFVPLQGKFDDMRATVWRDPPAVVLELPSAALDPRSSLRALRGGGVRRVRFEETPRANQLQIFVNVPVARFATKTSPKGLLVVLEHDLHPMR